MNLTPERIAALADAANAAPSADNRHAFRLETGPDFLAIRAGESLSPADPSRRVLGILSLGAVTENLVLRGREVGLELTPSWHPAGPMAGAAGRVDFAIAECAPLRSPLAAAIVHRHTNRELFFRGPRLPETGLALLSRESDGLADTAVQWLDEPEARRCALRLVRRAETERFRNPVLHRELFGSIRFAAGWRATTTEGLPPATLGLSPVERPAFPLLRHWGVQRAANRVGAHWFVGWRGADLPCRLAPHLGVVAAGGPIEMAAFQAGRLLERVWLQATVLGMAFQVFAASPLYALDHSTAIGPALRKELANGWAKLCPPDTRAMVAFRMGRSPVPAVRAGRPEASTLLASGQDSTERVVA
jgi:hypothetical protein